jgi:uncharacterized protein (TIGR02453 family)
MGFKARTPATGRLFGGETIEFLNDLDQNNNRDWFAEHKARYETCVREPALELIRQLAPHIRCLSRSFVTSDRKVGGSLMRVHRDTRFSSDKTPFKTNIGIHFRHGAGKDVHAPGLYIHIALDGCFVGVGSWRPEPASLAQIRNRIVTRPKEWAVARDDATFRHYFTLSGESTKRMPRGFDPDAPHADDLRRKDHTATASLTLADVVSPGLVDHCAARFAAARPYLRFLTTAVGATF